MESFHKVRELVVAGVVFSTLMSILFLILDKSSFFESHFRESFLGIAFFASTALAIVVYQSFGIDRSVKVLANDMLVYSRELFSELYRSSPVPYLLINDRGIIESMNFAAARLFNVEIGALDGIDVFKCVADENSGTVALIPEYFSNGRFVNDVETLIRRPDGKTRWVMLSLFSFKDAEGSRKGLLTLVDITKQKLIDKAKTEFVSLASHQLRTPISAMKWNVELLMTSGKEQLSTLQNAYIEKISHGLERMDILVSDFLSVSKFELGTLKADRAPLDLPVFCKTILDEQTERAVQKNIHLEAVLSETPQEVVTDAHLLHMVVSNLLSNAIKYTPEGGTVRFRATLDGTNATVVVADTGIGIPKEEQDMLFSKIFRASNAKAQAVDGTGLGLYIAREAMSVLGGTISFVSEEGKGTTFTVVLPK